MLTIAAILLALILFVICPEIYILALLMLFWGAVAVAILGFIIISIVDCGWAAIFWYAALGGVVWLMQHSASETGTEAH